MTNYLRLLACLFLTRCATPEPQPTVEKVEPAFYTLHSTKPIEHPAPLPNQVSILVNWKMSDGSTITSEGFRGWDVDHDGRFDVLEVLSRDGATTAWAYDFDGDGIVDALQTTEAVAMASTQGSVPIPTKEQAGTLLQFSH